MTVGWVQRLGVVAGLAAAALLFGFAMSGRLPKGIGIDYLAWESSTRLFAARQDLYDIDALAPLQQANGWDLATDGAGRSPCMVSYYPPWFNLAVLPLLALDFQTGKAVWVALCFECLVVAGFLLRGLAGNQSAGTTILVTAASGFALHAALIGQSPPVLVLLIAGSWRLLEQGRDGWAGSLLAWATFKPQLVVVLIPALFVWAARQGRWRLIIGYAVTLAVLVGGTCLVVPTWPRDLLQSLGRLPVPTYFHPGIGSTWLCLLRALGLESDVPGPWALYVDRGSPLAWGLYWPVALGYFAWVMATAWDRERPVGHVIGLALLAAPFVSPYNQEYDLALLAIPVLVLVGDRLPPAWALAVLLGFLVGPYVHAFWFLAGPTAKFWFLWVPILLTAAWLMPSPMQKAECRMQNENAR